MFFKEVHNFFNEDDFLTAFGTTKGFFLLDSGGLTSDVAKYSYACLNPKFAIVYSKRGTFVNGVLTKKPFLEVLKTIIEQQKREPGPFPFSGGLLGYLTYDFGWTLDKFNNNLKANKILGMPLAAFYYYDTVFVIDNFERKLFVVSEKEKVNINKTIDRLKRTNNQEACMFSTLRKSTSRKKYLEIIEKTKKYISNGHIYQANISQRFFCGFKGTPSYFYKNLRKISPAPFGAYFVGDDFFILSNSPERFLYKKGYYVETRPIKGTRKRFKDVRLDEAAKKELIDSVKDRAEHIMIVDLERNDLGRVCETGSVRVSDLMRIETYANVHHMVSIVSGTLKQDKDVIDCICAMFPGGSITGAPKLRSMEIIDELETVKRGVYCGSIGYIDASGNCDLNIAIRTGVINNGRLIFHVGGGIVADSSPVDEYEETIIKARSFMTAIGLGDVKE